MKIETINIELLIPYSNNIKEHPIEQIEQIKKSIIEMGFNDPIAIDENNIIIEGHGRLLALKELGYENVDVIILKHLTEIQKKKYRIFHNKSTMNTGFNLEMLKIELEEIKIDDTELGNLGFVDTELEEIYFTDIVEEFEEKEMQEFDEKKIPFSKNGDIWILGEHRLMCGDSTNEKDVEILMKNGKANLVITDPPYNVNYEGKTTEELKIINDNMTDEKFYNFLLKAYNNMFLFSEPGAGIYVFHSETEGINFRKAMLDAGYYYSQSCIWLKNSLVMGRQDYHWKHEPVLVGWKPGKAHNWYGDRKQTTVWEFNRPTKSEIHPTMKPLELISYPMLNSSKQGSIVLDLFGGSGTTLIASEMNFRECRMMEIDPKYVDRIVERYFNLQFKRVKILIRDGEKIEFKTFEDIEIELNKTK
ncbi:MAG: site-specific DNA-methyltransferase [Fusobacteriaceae bacterium]